MTHFKVPSFSLGALATAAMLACGAPAHAQQSQGGLLDGLFSRGQGQQDTGQSSGSDMIVRLERMENQLRQLTGAVEQLQFRNQQLEQQFKRMQDDTEYRFQELGARGSPAQRAPAAPQRRGDAVEPPASASGVATTNARRGDAFDPSQNPGAPGVPRVLGSAPSAGADAAIGAPGGRSAGAPLDLGTLSGAVASDGPPPGQRVVSADAASSSPREMFELGYGYLTRKDYAQAEETLRTFVRSFPTSRLLPEAEFWIGESLFQRQRYRDAAEAFLGVTTKFETAAKAPDAMLRLGQSLAELGEKETACAALGEVARKYPRAAVGLKQTVEREQKRVRC